MSHSGRDLPGTCFDLTTCPPSPDTYFSNMTGSTRVHHLDVDGEDGMRPGGVRVHLGGPDRPVLPALGHHGLALRRVTDSV